MSCTSLNLLKNGYKPHTRGSERMSDTIAKSARQELVVNKGERTWL